MDNVDVRDRAVKIARLLADRARFDIVLTLVPGEMNVTSLAETLGRPMPAVSQHLAKLRDGGLVVSRRDGSSVFYALAGRHVEELARHLIYQGEHFLFDTPPHHQH